MLLQSSLGAPTLSCARGSCVTCAALPCTPSSSHATHSINVSRRGFLAPSTLEPTATCTPSVRRMGVVCQAHPRRVARVASEMQRQISNLFVTDQVLVNAICPERAAGGNEISALASVTDVYVSNDLQVVKVYVSVYSDAMGKKRAMDRLKKLEGYTRTKIGQRVTLRLTPEIRFEYDDTLDQAEMIQKVIGSQEVKRLKQEIELEQQQAYLGGQQGSGGFFDDYEGSDEEEDYDEFEEEELAPTPKFVVGRTDEQMKKPGPFDELFMGLEDGDMLQESKGIQGSGEQVPVYKDKTEKNKAKRQRKKAAQ